MATERFEAIRKYIKDKEVLDCGCVEHEVYDDKPWWDYLWIHDKIVKEAKFCMGVDMEKEELKKLKEKGYNVRHADVETMELGRKFDVIVAGELIEHLGNPGSFLERSNAHLRKNGLIIITTPNVFSAGTVYRVLIGKTPEVNPQHVCYYDLKTLSILLERYGFEVQDVIMHQRPEAYKLNFLVKYRPDLAPTLIVVGRKIRNVEK